MTLKLERRGQLLMTFLLEKISITNTTSIKTKVTVIILYTLLFYDIYLIFNFYKSKTFICVSYSMI